MRSKTELALSPNAHQRAAQQAVLAALLRQPGQTCDQLATELGIRKATMARRLQTLTADGQVRHREGRWYLHQGKQPPITVRWQEG